MRALTDADFLVDDDNETYDAPPAIEFPLTNAFEELPFEACPGCGNSKISGLSQIFSERLRDVNLKIKDKTGRNMNEDDRNKATTAILANIAPIDKLPRSCCRLSIMEQQIVPDKPSHNLRYIEGVKTQDIVSEEFYGSAEPGKVVLRGNVAVQKIKEKHPYNPYTFNMGQYLANDETELEPPIIPPSVDVFSGGLFPSMPPIDDTFTEEVIDPHEGVLTQMFVKGIGKTGIVGLETPIIGGRTITAN